MTKDHSSVAGDHISDSADDPSRREQPVCQSRRRLLETMTMTGSVALAGCNLLGSGAEDNSEGESPTSGQTLRLPVDQNPSKASFYAPNFANELESTFAVTAKQPVSKRLKLSVREPGVWIDKRWFNTDFYYTWLEDITVSPTEVTVTIRDDATWSDGHPITGQDIALGDISRHIKNSFDPPYYATEEKDEPSLWWDAFDDFNVSDKSVSYRSSPGYFDQFFDWSLRTTFGNSRVSGTVVPTHIEPYDAYAEAVFETAHRAQQGEINPWKGWDDRLVQPDDPHLASLIEKHLAKGGKYVAKFSKPKHVVSTSAWDLVEISGPEAVFEPNLRHRNVDNINFEQLILEYTPSEKRVWAALKADRLDYAAPGPTPQAVVEALPGHITQLKIPGGKTTGNELLLNFNHPALGNRKVREALMYALDQSTIAKNIHQSATLPVTTPGGDCWDATDYVSKEWIEENLTTYTKDRDRAASLMRDAGYTKDGSQWRNADGKPLTLSFATPNGTPRWEPTVASQLTDFGIRTSVQTFQEATFEKRVDDGEYPMWTHSGVTTSLGIRTLVFWIEDPINQEKTGIYPKEQFQTGKFSVSGTPLPLTEERYDVFAIEAPPIGQPEGPLQTYHPSALAMGIFSNPPKAELRRRVKTTLWLAKWLLAIIPINKTLEQHFIDDAHWQWPTDTPAWEAFTSSGPKSIDGIFASGTLQANPDNPEDETP